MSITISYDDSFSSEERLILEKYESVLKKQWVNNANSTSSLEWKLSVQSEEPRMSAILKVKSNGREIHKESFYSLDRKSVEKFHREFVQSSIEYSSTS